VHKTDTFVICFWNFVSHLIFVVKVDAKELLPIAGEAKLNVTAFDAPGGRGKSEDAFCGSPTTFASVIYDIIVYGTNLTPRYLILWSR